MPDQEQTLKVTVQLDDQASAQLAQLRETLAGLGPQVARSTYAAKQGMNEFEKAVGELGRQALGVGRTFLNLVKVIGPGPVGFGLLAYEMHRHLGTMQDFSRGVVEMTNAATQAGISFGELRNITQQAAASGQSAQDAANMVKGFNTALAEMFQIASQRRDALINMTTTPQSRAAMTEAILQLSKMKNTVEALNYARHLGLQIRNSEKDATVGAFKQRTFLEQLNAVQLMNYNKDLTEADVKTLEGSKKLSEKEQKNQEAKAEERKVRQQIVDLMHLQTTTIDTTAILAAVALEKQILAAMQKITDLWQNKFSFENLHKATMPVTSLLQGPTMLFDVTMRAALAREAQKQGQGQRFGAGALPTLPGVNKQAFQDWLSHQPLSTHIEDRRQFWSGWPQSKNIEDRRNDSLDANTKQLEDMNNNILRLMDLTGGAGAGLGAGQVGPGGYSTSTMGPRVGTGPTTPGGNLPTGFVPPVPITGPTGIPLGDVMAGKPWGVNVGPQDFTRITGLHPGWMNVSPQDVATSRQLSAGMAGRPLAGIGLKGEFVGTPTQPWPVTSSAGGPGGSLSAPAMTVLDAIAHAEVNHPFLPGGERGGYNETVSNQSFDPSEYPTSHPYESGKFRYFQGRYGPSSASGRYQETLTTYRENVKKYGISGFSKDAQDKRAFMKASDLYRQSGAWRNYPGATGNLEDDSAKFGGDPNWWTKAAAPGLHREWTSVPGGLEPNDKTRNWIASAVTAHNQNAISAKAAPSGSGYTTSQVTGVPQKGAVPGAATATGAAVPGDARYSQAGQFALGGDKRRQELTQAAAEASKFLPPGYRVEAVSGQREGGLPPHVKQGAIDFQIYDDKGNKVNWYQSPKDFALYENFAQHTHLALQRIDPQLAQLHRWGGYFSGPIGQGGKYGAMDIMHQDFGGPGMMAAGSWEKGINPEWARQWGVTGSSQGIASVAAQEAAAAAGTAGKTTSSGTTQGTLLFLHGMENKYDQGGVSKTPQEIEAEARRIADAKGLKFEVINVSGQYPAQQEAAARARLAQGGITDILGFSAGGNTADRLRKDFPGINYMITGAKSVPGDLEPDPKHMRLVEALANQAEAAAKANKGTTSSTDSDAQAARSELDRRWAEIDKGKSPKIIIEHKDAPPDVSVKAHGFAFKRHTMNRTNAPPAEAGSRDSYVPGQAGEEVTPNV